MSFNSKREKITKILTNYNWHTEADLFDNIFDEVEKRAISKYSKELFVTICLKEIKTIFK